MKNETFESLMFSCAPYSRGGKKWNPLRTPQDIQNAKIKIPKTKPMDEGWKNEQKNMFWWGDPEKQKLEENKKMNLLREKLIAIGGENAAIDKTDLEISGLSSCSFYDILMNYGQLLYSGYRAIIIPSTIQSRCHTSSNHFHLANEESTRVCCGYAMSEDGLWRFHSWVICLGKNIIIECTPTRRLVYYGVVIPNNLISLLYNHIQ